MQISYNTAQLTAAFVGSMLSGKPIPAIEELYPSLKEDMPKDNTIGIADEKEKQQILLKEKFYEFARMHNKQRSKALANDSRRTENSN